MGSVVNLESFDMQQTADNGPTAAYQDGYDAGYAAATEAANYAADQLRSDLVQTLSDMTFTYREAQQDVMASFASLIQTLVETVLPTCVDLGLARQIADLVMDRQAANHGETVVVHVHPSQQHPVAQATADIAARITIMADATLSPHAAWIGNAGGDTYLDMDICLAEIAELLSSLHHDNQRNSANG